MNRKIIVEAHSNIADSELTTSVNNMDRSGEPTVSKKDDIAGCRHCEEMHSVWEDCKERSV